MHNSLEGDDYKQPIGALWQFMSLEDQVMA
jgi:hypothetical protein